MFKKKSSKICFDLNKIVTFVETLKRLKMKNEILNQIEIIRGYLDQLQDELNLQVTDTNNAEFLANHVRNKAQKLEDAVESFHYNTKNNEE